MSLETMLAVLNEQLNEDENKAIQPLTETPSKVYKPKNLTEAEDEIKEIDKDEKEKDDEYREAHSDDDNEEDTMDDYEVVNPDETVDSIGDKNVSDEEIDEKMMNFTTYQLLTTQFLKLEYGTPAGSDSGLCPSCGTEDAADAAIIDSEITDAERTEPFEASGGDTGGFSSGDTGTSDDEFGGDFSFYYEQRAALEKCIPGTENFFKTFGAIFKFSEKVFHTVAQNATRLIRATLRVGEHNLVKVRYMAKFYQFKLTKLINFIDDEQLDKIEVEAWPADLWYSIEQQCFKIYDLCKDVDKQLAAKPGAFKDIKAKYDKLYKAIKVDTSLNGVKSGTHALFDLRRAGNVSSLGYGKDAVVKSFRHLEELGDIVGVSAMKEITVSLKKAALHIKAETEKLKAKQKTGIDDANIKKEMDMLQAYNLRYNYLSNCVQIYTEITSRMTDDLYRVSKAYETSIVPKYVR